ncbi:hypothetical protein ILYODFUR_015784 [Ilyodon furcidens]|uniref:Uncharacterized protein n=1 Tax=Ilyodon furcidens TaxID=33524 RepID=A0ABV0UHU4_9TELE
MEGPRRFVLLRGRRYANQTVVVSIFARQTIMTLAKSAAEKGGLFFPPSCQKVGGKTAGIDNTASEQFLTLTMLVHFVLTWRTSRITRLMQMFGAAAKAFNRTDHRETESQRGQGSGFI